MLRKLIPVLLLVTSACYGDTVQIILTGLPVTNENGSYNGYATATIGGVPNQLLICDDYVSETQVPSTLIVDFSSLTGAAPLQYARFDQPNPPTVTQAQQTQLYDEAAVILWQFSQQAAPTGDTVTAYQYALWNLMNPTVALDPSLTTQEHQIQTTAQTYVTTPSQAAFLASNVYPNLSIYTPTAAYASNQELLSYATAPEPAMFPLMAGALLVLWWRRSFVLVPLRVQNRQQLPVPGMTPDTRSQLRQRNIEAI